jgi:hypothetical protein
MGQSNYKLINGTDQLFGRFSKQLVDKIAIVVDECHWGSLSKKDANLLKGFVTSTELRSEEKHHPESYVQNCTHVITMTNEEQPCPLEKGKPRRYYPLVASLVHVMEQDKLFDQEEVKAYTTALMNNLDNNFYGLAALLYAWPTYMLDKFNAGHGIDNSHLTILAAASKRFTLQHSLSARWWYTILEESSPLSSFLASNAKDMLPSDYSGQNGNDLKDRRLCKQKLEALEHMLDTKHYDPKSQASLDKISAIGEIRELGQGPYQMGDLLEIFKQNNLSHMACNLEAQKEEDMMDGLLRSADGNQALKDIMTLVAADGKTKMKKVKKTQLAQEFMDWFRLEDEKASMGAEHLSKNKNKAPGADMLFHNLIYFVPWLFHIKDKEWVCVGTLDVCRTHLKNVFKTEKNISVSSRDCMQVLDEIFQVEEEDQEADHFSSMFSGDRTFIYENGSWYLKFMLGKEGSNNTLIPLKWKLTEEQQKLLLEEGFLDWGPILNDITACVRITDIEDPLLISIMKENKLALSQRGSCSQSEIITRTSCRIQRLIEKPLETLKLKFPPQIFYSETFFINGVKAGNHYWNSLSLYGNRNDIGIQTKTKHSRSNAYKLIFLPPE